MFEEILIDQNPHWENEKYLPGAARTCFPKLIEYFGTGQIVAIMGVRCAGKSTLLKQLIDDLIENQQVPFQNILFFNLEHPYLSPYREDVETLQQIYEEYLKLMQPEGEVYVFLDEVQFFEQWPVFVKAHHETKKARFVITGSNAAMLSSDMVTLLSGRSLPLEVFPFSLRELASFNAIDFEKPFEVSKNGPKIAHLLDELLKYGGFPIVVINSKSETAYDILGAHARMVLLQDVAPRLAARKVADLEKLYVYLVTHISKLFSYSSLSKLFDLADKSIKEYIQALEDAHLIYEVDLFSYSLKKQIRNPKKVYAIDTGQANAMGFKFSANRGKLLENLIFLELKRLGLEVYYYVTKENYEIDFVVKRGSDIALLQVAWEINDPQTKERELRALEGAKKELKCQRGIVLSYEPLENQEVGMTAHRFLSLSQKKQLEYLFQ